jgi:hypothetical protein
MRDMERGTMTSYPEMAHKPQIRPLACLGDTVVAVRPQDNGLGQDILVQGTAMGKQLARFLTLMAGPAGACEPKEEVVEGRSVYVIPHSRDLDERVRELVDLFILLRWEHPRLMQLELVLSPGGSKQARR